MIDIVFDGPPGPKAGRFVEIESPPGISVNFSEWWIKRDDGYWVLRFDPDTRLRAINKELVDVVEEAYDLTARLERLVIECNEEYSGAEMETWSTKAAAILTRAKEQS